jgi:iron-sulfur cluster assembly accessory protein
MFRELSRLNNTHRIVRAFRQLHSDPQALNVTSRAAQQLKHIAKDGERLRITVEGGGCAGFEYKLKLDAEQQPDDVLVEKDGATVVVDEVNFD